MDEATLVRFFNERESDRVERKAAIGDWDRIRQAICAFANDLPDHRQAGVIFIGQNDDLTCANIKIDDQLLITLSHMRDDGKIQPFPPMSVDKLTVHGCEVAVIIVEPSHDPPIRLDGSTWIRVGARRARATPEEERRLTEKRRWGSLPFERQPVVGATVNDLNLPRFRLEYLPSLVSRETLEQNERTIEQQLSTLRLIGKDGTPTVAGVLLIGTDPQSWFPGAYVQWRRVAGVNLTDDTYDEKVVTGTLIDQVRVIDEIMDAANATGIKLRGAAHERSADYPPEALRQVVRNALMHRNYEGTNAPVRVTWFDDRVEIWNPGGPYGTVTVDNFGKPGVADYRNQAIAEAFKGHGFVERFGMGLQIVRQTLQRNGNPRPDFEVQANYINVTLRKAP